MSVSETILGRITTRHGQVVWAMDPDEARELADPADLAHRDVAALRREADLLDPPEAA